MVDVSRIDTNQKVYNNFENTKVEKKDDISIFGNQTNPSVETLEANLNSIKANNGFILDGWDDIKNGTKLGVSSSDCENAIEEYKKGKITFEEAEAKIQEYKTKQDSSLNLFSNIATGAAAIIAGTAIATTGGLALPIVTGILTGAATKAGFKATDRATNKVEGDALDGKQLAKDALSGAITGGIAVATAGTGGNAFNNGFKIGGKTVIDGGTKACMANSAVLGLKTGAISGASNNLIECAFEEDKEFNLKDFATETVTSSIVGGTVGSIMGGVNGTLRTNNLLNAGGSVNVANTTQDIAANTICNAEYKIVNNAVRSIAA